MKRFIESIAEKVVQWSRGAARDGNYVAHFEREWAIAFPPTDDAEENEMQAAIKQSVLDVLRAFSLAGHSGFSAPYAIGIIEKILRWQPLSPLTGEPDEWTEIGMDGEKSIFQNKRDSSVFKDGEDAPAYCVEGKVFVYPDGVAVQHGGSRVPVEFPWTKPETIFVNIDEDGNEIPSETVEVPRKLLRNLGTIVGEIADALEGPAITDVTVVDLSDHDADLLDLRDLVEEADEETLDLDARDIITSADLIPVPRGILAAASYIIGKSPHAGGNVANKIRNLSLTKKGD
jgi:hypothetical protein